MMTPRFVASACSDEEQLGAVGLVDEIAGADDVLDAVVKVVRRQVVHVGGHPAGPQVARAVIPGSPPRPWGRWVAGLPSIVILRWAMVSLVMMSKPQNVKNRWV